jgi:predicted DNA-binding protein
VTDSVQLTIRLPRETRDRLEAEARADRRTIAGLARVLIEDGVQHRDREHVRHDAEAAA